MTDSNVTLPGKGDVISAVAPTTLNTTPVTSGEKIERVVIAHQSAPGTVNDAKTDTPLPVVVTNPTTNPETGLAKDGTDINAPTSMPSGGVGIRGWLSAIWTKINGTVTISGSITDAVEGSTTDAPASVDDAETGTAHTGIALWKGIKNILILVKTILGATDGTAVITDANGTIQQYLRGLVKLIAAKIAVQLDLGGTAISQTNPLPVSQTRVVCAIADVHAPAANTAAIVTYAADATKKHVITGVAWSYAGGTPVGGNLKIEDVVGTVIFTVDIDKSGPGGFEFPRPKIGAAANTAMVVTLAAGGAGVTGKVSVENHWLE